MEREAETEAETEAEREAGLLQHCGREDAGVDRAGCLDDLREGDGPRRRADCAGDVADGVEGTNRDQRAVCGCGKARPAPEAGQPEQVDKERADDDSRRRDRPRAGQRVGDALVCDGVADREQEPERKIASDLEPLDDARWRHDGALLGVAKGEASVRIGVARDTHELHLATRKGNGAGWGKADHLLRLLRSRGHRRREPRRGERGARMGEHSSRRMGEREEQQSEAAGR